MIRQIVPSIWLVSPLATVVLGLLVGRAEAQESRAFSGWSLEQSVPAAPSAPSPSYLFPVSDSVRTKVGYHHWEGASGAE